MSNFAVIVNFDNEISDTEKLMALISIQGNYRIQFRNYYLKGIITQTEIGYVNYIEMNGIWIRIEDEICSELPDYRAVVNLITKNLENPIIFSFEHTINKINIVDDFCEIVFESLKKRNRRLEPDNWICNKCETINNLPWFVCKGIFFY